MQFQDIFFDYQNEVQVNGFIVCKGSVGVFFVSVCDWQDFVSDDVICVIVEVDLCVLLLGLYVLGLFQVLVVCDLVL